MNNHKPTEFTDKYDVTIVGSGVAGLFTALNLPSSLKILMITKDKPENSDSFLAQGGICTLKNPDDYDAYYEDTIHAGHYKNNPQSVEVMIRSSVEIIKDLIGYGVQFDKMENGEFSYTKEGAHSTARILHHKDITGEEITGRLLDHVSKSKNITLLSHTCMTDLIIGHSGACEGILVKLPDQPCRAIRSKVTVLATGGLGGLFKHSTNFRHITGDSIAIALKHNIRLENLHYIQIHPTVLYSNQNGRKFLISESVRGEGALLFNTDKKRFVDELLPRDRLTEAICHEMRKFHTEYVYLSLTHIPETEIVHRFPNIYAYCLEQGYDLTREMVPVTPAQHYLMGGIQTDTTGHTSCKNLYAVGETACNGVHGANRLASNSLLESLVFSKRAANDIAKLIHTIHCPDAFLEPDFNPCQNGDYREEFRSLIMNEIKRRDEEFYAAWCCG